MKNKFIILHDWKDESEVYINIDTIGHIYFTPEKIEYGRVAEKSYTRVGILTHNNGGLKVKETPKEIFKIISELEK